MEGGWGEGEEGGRPRRGRSRPPAPITAGGLFHIKERQVIYCISSTFSVLQNDGLFKVLMLCEIVKRNQPLLETYCFHTFRSLFARRLWKYKQTTGFIRHFCYLFRCAKSLLHDGFLMILRATFYQDRTFAFLEPLTQMSVQIFSRDLTFVIWPVNIMHPRNYHKLKSKY